MFKAVFASLRLAFALVCVGLGLILGAQWFGLLPDSRLALDRARHLACQTIAISVLDDVRHERWLNIDSMLIAIENRDEDLLSVGLRNDLGQLKVATENHQRCWKGIKGVPEATETAVDDVPVWAKASLSNDRKRWQAKNEGASSTKSQVSAATDANPVCLQIPIIVRNEPWGQLEFCFRESPVGLFGGLLDAGISGLLVFFAICGMGSYTLLMMRIMGVFSRTQVVPDRVRQALDTLAEGLLVLDGSGKIVLANENFLSINGFESEELIDRLASDLPWFFTASDPRRAAPESAFPWTRAIKERKSVTAEILRMTGRDGVHRVFSVNAGPIGDERNQKGALVTFQDVTHVEKHRVELENMLTMLRRSKDEIQRKNRELEILATRDALTGCLNRRAFFERMEPLLDEHRRDGRSMSCFMVDVDHFKSVNDTYGHHTGDEVLREVSKSLRKLFEEEHIVCRYGGEEFCVVLPGFDLDQALDEAERTRLAIMNIRLAEPAELRLTASIGVSELRFGATETQDLINQADECLYVAKRGGRNQSVLYDPDRISVLGEEEPQTNDTADPDLAQLPLTTVSALLSALAHRDPSTAEHSRRVANLCVQAAEGLLSEHDMHVLEVAALLHDIGKIGVPDKVLHKPGKLDENEWKIMHRHKEVGLDMVAGTFHCDELDTIIRAHHLISSVSSSQNSTRHVDISNVPLASRLLNIADTYDSMVSDHAYRQGCSAAEAIAELRRGAGTQFDPDLVERFVETTATEGCDSEMGSANSQVSTVAIPESVSSQIGEHMEGLAGAINSQNRESLQHLVGKLKEIAEANSLTPITDVTQRIISRAVPGDDSEEVQWSEVLRETQTLLDLCRLMQDAPTTQKVT